MTTIYGFENYRYFVPANNPWGHTIWFPTREARDAAADVFEADAAAAGLSNPKVTRVLYPVQTNSQRAWLRELQERGTLRPMDDMSHEWREAE